MKPGAGDDPFADEPAEQPDDPEEPPDEPERDTDPMTQTQTTADSSEEQTDDDDIPWVLRRSRVKEDRTDVRQFFLREEASNGERQLRNDVEEQLGKDVRKLDLREAAYLVAQRHPDEVAEELQEWGYDYL